MPVFDFHRAVWTAWTAIGAGPRGLASLASSARTLRRACLLVGISSIAWSTAAGAESHRHLHPSARHDVARLRANDEHALHVPHARGGAPVKIDAVKICVASLGQAVRRNRRYDRLLQLDSDVLRAQVDVQRHDALFSITQPVLVETTVTLHGSARARGQWKWQPVTTRCGLRAGRVVTTSIEPRSPPPRPVVKPPRRPAIDYFNYVDNSEWTPHIRQAAPTPRA